MTNSHFTLRAAMFAATMAMSVAGCADGSQADRRGGGDAPSFVSLNPCLDAILVDVADPTQILALSHYSRDPSSSSISQEVAQQFDVTGGTAEEVLALKPDIVLASSFISPATRAAFERLGLRVETFGSPTNVAASLGQIRQLAALTGNEARGDNLLHRIEQSITSSAASPQIQTMIWQPGQIVPGEQTLVAEVLAMNNFTNASAEMGLEQADYVSLEKVLTDPPQLLLVAGDSVGQNHPALGALTGTRVESFDPQLLYCGGPTIIALQGRLDEIRASFE